MRWYPAHSTTNSLIDDVAYTYGIEYPRFAFLLYRHLNLASTEEGEEGLNNWKPEKSNTNNKIEQGDPLKFCYIYVNMPPFELCNDQIL